MLSAVKLKGLPVPFPCLSFVNPQQGPGPH